MGGAQLRTAGRVECRLLPEGTHLGCSHDVSRNFILCGLITSRGNDCTVRLEPVKLEYRRGARRLREQDITRADALFSGGTYFYGVAFLKLKKRDKKGQEKTKKTK